MSPSRRASSASVASMSSRRFFSRITVWDFCGFDQRLGSAACFSTSVSCVRRRPASKILPQVANLLFQLEVFLFEFFDHQLFVRVTNGRRASATTEIIAHRYANQSP